MSHDGHTLAGAYAMAALTDTERRCFERHLAGCATCAQEARELRETAARLAMAGSRKPRPACTIASSPTSSRSD